MKQNEFKNMFDSVADILEDKAFMYCAIATTKSGDVAISLNFDNESFAIVLASLMNKHPDIKKSILKAALMYVTKNNLLHRVIDLSDSTMD